LEAERYIERGDAPSRKRRPIRLTEKGWEALGEVPVMGRIAAGRGLEAVSSEDEVYSLIPGVLLSKKGKRRYVLRVVGDSMIGAHIGDGDILIVEENEDPPDGTVVAALIDGEEVTVKRLYRRGDDLLLKPQNGHHEDIVVPADRVEIQGEVVIVMHPPRR
jgi:repressor LexA